MQVEVMVEVMVEIKSAPPHQATDLESITN